MLWYGHGSWVFVVVLLAVFLLRTVAARRRGPGPSRGPGPNRGAGYGAPAASPFPPAADRRPVTDPPVPPAGTVVEPVRGDPAGHRGVPAGWLVDPSGRHQQRFWSGTTWTEHVTDDGVPGVDPPPGTDPS
ncbi:MAG TPA: DUF2510 domain-containing protein [Acidimicrobiales bacterium]|jgi:hypothetical protein|nr:DUF2510 domain-containing protein [Acidimicrobiales bacterium]